MEIASRFFMDLEMLMLKCYMIFWSLIPVFTARLMHQCFTFTEMVNLS